MTNVISIDDKREYAKEVAKLTALLNHVENDLETYMINLLAKGNWKSWSAKQPEGTVFEFTQEMFDSTGDKNVDLLRELTRKVMEVRDGLNKMSTKELQ
jgi:hypothetical protein